MFKSSWDTDLAKGKFKKNVVFEGVSESGDVDLIKCEKFTLLAEATTNGKSAELFVYPTIGGIKCDGFKLCEGSKESMIYLHKVLEKKFSSFKSDKIYYVGKQEIKWLLAKWSDSKLEFVFNITASESVKCTDFYTNINPVGGNRYELEIAIPQEKIIVFSKTGTKEQMDKVRCNIADKIKRFLDTGKMGKVCHISLEEVTKGVL